SPQRDRADRVTRHRRSLADVSATERQVVELVKNVLDPEIDPNLLPGVARAQVDQVVAGSLLLVTDRRDIVLGLCSEPLEGVIPATILVRQRELHVER